MKFLTIACTLMVLMAVARAQTFEDFQGFDASSFDSNPFGGQDLSNFETGSFDGSFADAGDFAFDQFGGDVDFSAFQKKK